MFFHEYSILLGTLVSLIWLKYLENGCKNVTQSQSSISKNCLEQNFNQIVRILIWYVHPKKKAPCGIWESSKYSSKWFFKECQVSKNWSQVKLLEIFGHVKPVTFNWLAETWSGWLYPAIDPPFQSANR